MEVPTRGATCRCASVSEGFLHRNCVLSVPSQPPFTVVLSKRLDTNSALSHKRLLVLSFFLSCEYLAAVIWNMKFDSDSVSGVNCSYFHSRTSFRINESSNCLIKQTFLRFQFLLKKKTKKTPQPCKRSFCHWQTGLRVACRGVRWLTAALCNHITDSAKDPHHNLSLKSH